MDIFLIYLAGVVIAYFVIGLIDHITNDDTNTYVALLSWVAVASGIIMIIINGFNFIPSAKILFERKPKLDKDQAAYDEREELYKQFNYDDTRDPMFGDTDTGMGDTDPGIDINKLTDMVLERIKQREEELKSN